MLTAFQLACSFSLIHDYSLLKVMFGNITEMKDLSLPPMDEIKAAKNEQPSRYEGEYDVFGINNTDMMEVLQLIEVDPKERKYAYPVLEFNFIMKSLSEGGGTRRFWSWLAEAVNTVVNAAANVASQAVDAAVNGAVDFYNLLAGIGTYDSKYYRGKIDSAEGNYAMEFEKFDKLRKLMLCLLIHTRYRVDKAIRQRKKSWPTKAYRLGYLFNRLRRVKYMQAKAINTATLQRKAAEQIRPPYNSPHHYYAVSALRWYEKMLHLDVDMRDLCTLIYKVLDEPDPKKKEDLEQKSNVTEKPSGR